MPSALHKKAAAPVGKSDERNMFPSMNATGTDGTGAVAQLLQMQQQQQPLPDEEYSSSARPRWKKPKRGVSELVSRAVVCMCWFASDQLCAGSFFFPKRSAFFSLGSAAVSGCACHAMPCLAMCPASLLGCIRPSSFTFNLPCGGLVISFDLLLLSIPTHK